MNTPDPFIMLLGDPHLGRHFITGVPVHRRGERELSQLDDFASSLTFAAEKGMEMHVMMGDIFDKFVVSPELVLWVADQYQAVAAAARSCKFVLLRGNHDVSRNTDKKSSFDVLARLIGDEPNIYVVEAEPRVIDGYGFVGFDPFTPLADTIAMLPKGVTTVFTHHDYVDFGGDQVLPTQLMAELGITTVYNGHDHVARTETRHGVEVHMVGSMQPYTHAEDKNGDLYRTVTLEELKGLDTTNLNIRVRLKEGETLPTDLDCLSLNAIRDTTGDEDGTKIDASEFESLEIRSMLEQTLEGLDCKAELMEAFDAA